jgi:hypothetical protein
VDTSKRLEELERKVQMVFDLYNKTLAEEHDDSNFEDGYRAALSQVSRILA